MWSFIRDALLNEPATYCTEFNEKHCSRWVLTDLDGVPLGVHGLVADEEVEVLDAPRQPPRGVVPHLGSLLHRDGGRDDVLRLLVTRIAQLGIPEKSKIGCYALCHLKICLYYPAVMYHSCVG